MPGLILMHDPSGDFGEISRRRKRSLSPRNSGSWVWPSVMFHGLALPWQPCWR
jgi:hypothetical protein